MSNKMSEGHEAELRAFEEWQREMKASAQARSDCFVRSRAQAQAFWAQLPREQADDLRRAEHGVMRSSGDSLAWQCVFYLVLLVALVALIAWRFF